MGFLREGMINMKRIKRGSPKEIDKNFLLQLQGSYLSLRNKMALEWKRDLPFFELCFDRWERAKHLKFGKKASIYHNSYVYGDVKAGKSTWIGPFTVLDGSGGLEIGDFCSISSGVQIYSHNSLNWALSGGKQKYGYAKVKIDDCCYIGPSAIISKGVTIGHHCVVAALSLVNKNFPPFSIIGGMPAKVIGKIVIDARGKIELIYLHKK